MTYYIYRDRNQHYRWRLVTSNSRIIADSAEGYWNKGDCESAINLVKGSNSAPVVELK
jgi:uncharacterized protein YegP (UPF0339 family)